MRLASPLNICLTQEQQSRYEAEAALLGQSLTTYIRNRLTISDVYNDIQSLNQAQMNYSTTAMNIKWVIITQH